MPRKRKTAKTPLSRGIDVPMDRRCRQCDSRCCRYFCIPIPKPDLFEEFENIRWYLAHRGVSVFIDLDGEWWVRMDSRCGLLDRRGQCKDYANRSMVCRTFSPDGCEVTQGGHACEELFRTPKQLDAYARRMLGEIAYGEGLARRLL
jgi:Fe-S-cluster containining protein